MGDIPTGYTPGPWRVHLVDDTSIVDESGAEVANVGGDYNQPETWPEMEANARLIAAAPDMAAEIARLKGEVERLTLLARLNADYIRITDGDLATLRAENEKLRRGIKLWQDAYETHRNEPLVIAYEGTAASSPSPAAPEQETP